MAIPIYDPYRREQPNVIGAVRLGLDMQLAHEKMMIDDARARQMAAMEERNRERQHQQQMAQFGLNEMKFNYEKQQDEVGGLKYQETMARIGQLNSGTMENQAQADYYKRRAENPEAFRSPGATARPRVIPLTAGQIKANADAAALGQPLPYKVTVVNPGTGDYGSAYTNANVNDPNDPALRDLQASIAEQSPDGNPYTVGPVANDPTAGELPHDSQGTNDNSLLDPNFIPPANPSPPNLGPQTPAPTFQPGDVVPIDPATPAGQGALPMDPASVQRRQAMEYERIKKQASVSAALNRQKADATAALAVDPKDPVALAQKAAADEELKKLFTPPPKASVVQDEPVGQQYLIDRATGQKVPARPMDGSTDMINVPDAGPPPAATDRPGIGILPKAAVKDNTAANEFWSAGKERAHSLADLGNATDEELKAIATGDGQRDDLGFAASRPYSEMLANKISDRFQRPKGGDDPAVRGRSGEVTTEDFVRAAAADELKRRMAKSSKTAEPSAKAKTITGNWEK